MEETITSAPLLAFCVAGIISLMILAVLIVRKKLTIFERIMALLTFFALVITAATAGFVFNQVDAMRKDQRPWVHVSMNFAPIQESNPIISGTMQILNSGKTPAKSVNGTFFVEKVVNGDEPTFVEKKPFATMTTGIKFPNIPSEHQLIVHAILQPELVDLRAGKIFFVVYGSVVYTDFFRIKHWTKFCRHWTLGPGTYTSQKCAEYNDIDDN